VQNQNRIQPCVKPLIPGQPGPNFPATKICNYCKTPGHFIKECRKLAYRRSLQQNQLQTSTSHGSNNQENFQGVPMLSARRNEMQEGRQILTQQPSVPVNVNATIIRRENILQENSAHQGNLTSTELTS